MLTDWVKLESYETINTIVVIYKNYSNHIKKVYLCLLRIFNTDILKYNKL